MDELLNAIRAAAAPDATSEARAMAAAACRTILVALEATPGQPVADAVPTPPPATANVAPQVAQVVGALRGLPADQLLDLAIARLRSALPAGVTVPEATPIKFHIVPVPPRK